MRVAISSSDEMLVGRFRYGRSDLDGVGFSGSHTLIQDRHLLKDTPDGSKRRDANLFTNKPGKGCP